MHEKAPRYFHPSAHESQVVQIDVCVYGGVSGGVIAAVEAARRGLSVVLLEPGSHLGGMTAGGLGMTDIGNKAAIGGLAREFYKRVGRHYGAEIEWRFEPHVAEETFEAMLKETSVRVFRRQCIDKVQVQNKRIVALQTISGIEVRAHYFIDASYEGDLMARAGVSYRVGRESNTQYGETFNGAHIRELHQFGAPVDPYVIPGTPGSGLLPGIDPSSDYVPGQGDRRLQAYNFRMCLTRDPSIRAPFPKPTGYDDAWYLLLKRHLATGWNEVFEKFDPVRNQKTDTNNHGPVSTDFIGQNHAYPEASYEEREKIFQAHVRYQQGLMWCLANDPEIPGAIREPMAQWGLCRDEFQDSGGWPFALYVREARRMVSDYVMNEMHCRGEDEAADAVGLAAYGMDSHNCRRLVQNGMVKNEGDVQIHISRPYPISYRSIVPRRSECANLFVPFCLSASHIAFGSIRMEPVLMVLGQGAAIAASLAFSGKAAVQDVPYADLHRELLGAGIVLSTQTANEAAHAELVVT